MKTALIIGATGDVGQGISEVLINNGWQIIAAGRSEEKLSRLETKLANNQLSTVVADISNEQGVEQLWQQATSLSEHIDAVIVTVNTNPTIQPLFNWSSDELTQLIQQNLITHFVAAKTIIPQMDSNAMYIGIGGGMADFLVPGFASMSMCQSAQRMMFKAISKENKPGPQIRELMILSMVNGESRRNQAEDFWVTDIDIGHHVQAILADPEQFSAPILALKNRQQVGQAE